MTTQIYDSKQEWRPDYSKVQRRIVCAANRLELDDNEFAVVLGIRHHDNAMHNVISERNKGKGLFENEDWGKSEQGFVDQFGDFLSREEAWVIASAANQISELVGNQTEEDKGKAGIKLYSENLY